MKLTKEQRHMIYMLMLAELEEYNPCYVNSDGFCFMAFHIFGLRDNSGFYDDIISDELPELQKRKPKLPLSSGLWFPVNTDIAARKKRIKLLKQCINETYYPF